jgi:hypothetical protein
MAVFWARWKPATSAAGSGRVHAEMLKHTGGLPIIGVNTFRNRGDAVQDKLDWPALPTKQNRSSAA